MAKKKGKQAVKLDGDLANPPAEKEQPDEAKNSTGDAPPADSTVATDAEPKGETKTADGAEKQDDTRAADGVDSIEINPIAFEITLKAHHPQDSYGRCGYRFVKDEALEIPVGDLTGEQIITLSQDPYLEFVPVCEAV